MNSDPKEKDPNFARGDEDDDTTPDETEEFPISEEEMKGDEPSI